MINNAVTMIVRQLGITSKYKGYYYLIEAVRIKAELADQPVEITKDIYPEVARKYNTSETCIEHGIRKVSHVLWEKHRTEFEGMSDVPLDFAPTNSVMVDILAFHVRNKSQKSQE